MARQPGRRPQGSSSAPPRSIRVEDIPWEKARRRANYEGVTLSYVVQTIIDGYGEGLIDLPKTTVVYSPPRGT